MSVTVVITVVAVAVALIALVLVSRIQLPRTRARAKYDAHTVTAVRVAQQARQMRAQRVSRDNARSGLS